MKKAQEFIFDSLLKERKRLSKKDAKNKQIVSSDDAELIDMIETFNESNEYKEMQSDN